MENATITKRGKGWWLSFENGKGMPVSWAHLPETLIGKAVQVKRENGQPVEIIAEGVSYKKSTPFDAGQNQSSGYRENPNYRSGGKQQYGRNGGMQNYNQDRRENRQQEGNPAARAPYNFVPLNTNEIVDGNEQLDHDSFQPGRFSGYINIDIEALTDIFTRGKLEKNFMFNGQYAIPGSSLRGLIRSLTEMVSYSQMEYVDKKRKLFFRNISDDYYKDIFISATENNVQQKSKSGWLSKSGAKYFLQEAPTFYKVNRNALRIHNLDSGSIYHHQQIWFDKSAVSPIHTKIVNTRNGQKTLNLHYNKVNSISLTNAAGLTKATLLTTGLFGTSKHFQWIIPHPATDSQKYDVTSIVEDYERDENRNEGANLIKALKNSEGHPIPCFFIKDNGNEPIAIGHTGIFRYPYKYSIGHAIKQRQPEKYDFTQAIFGFASTDSNNKSEKIVAGRVFFEDTLATHISGTEFGALKILSSPKPTSFQLYLEQQNGNNLHNWSTDSHTIRGHKLYWHKMTNWRNPKPNIEISANTQQELIRKVLELKEAQYTVGEVLKAKSTFHGRIRFENLTKEELGALLFVLDLPVGCAHKLGMGKPLGLGSVRITPTLTLINRQARYAKVFDDNGNWFTGETSETDLTPYKDAFAKYIGSKTNQFGITDAASYWATDPRMEELKHMLTFDHDPGGASWEERTRYMEIEHPLYRNEYRDRPVLPKPSEVVQKDTYKKL